MLALHGSSENRSPRPPSRTLLPVFICFRSIPEDQYCPTTLINGLWYLQNTQRRTPSGSDARSSSWWPDRQCSSGVPLWIEKASHRPLLNQTNQGVNRSSTKYSASDYKVEYVTRIEPNASYVSFILDSSSKLICGDLGVRRTGGAQHGRDALS